MKKIFTVVLILLTMLLMLSQVSLAETSALDWGLFKIYNSPAWVWGQNGGIITPTSEVATNGIYLTGYILNTGTYNNEPAGFSTNTLELSTGNLEVGVSKKYLLLNWERLNVDSTIIHFKFQPFVTKFFNVAVGSISIQIGPNPLAGTSSDQFFNDVFAVAGIKLGPLSLNGGCEYGLVASEQTKSFYFVNGKITLGGSVLIAEGIATDREGKGGIYNVALASNNKNLNWGFGVLDLSGGAPQITLFGSFKY
ncbi:MAG TPA: hypothetical protein VHY08_08795 [Bacillota bacterium]|nr:hypothetical protein [Bacillota bacterium]